MAREKLVDLGLESEIEIKVKKINEETKIPEELLLNKLLVVERDYNFNVIELG